MWSGFGGLESTVVTTLRENTSMILVDAVSNKNLNNSILRLTIFHPLGGFGKLKNRSDDICTLVPPNTRAYAAFILPGKSVDSDEDPPKTWVLRVEVLLMCFDEFGIVIIRFSSVEG